VRLASAQFPSVSGAFHLAHTPGTPAIYPKIYFRYIPLLTNLSFSSEKITDGLHSAQKLALHDQNGPGLSLVTLPGNPVKTLWSETFSIQANIVPAKELRGRANYIKEFAASFWSSRDVKR
jgi:hypothetical protein